MTPDVRVVRGRPDELELAALVAGLAAGGAVAAQLPDAAADQAAQAARAAGRRWRHAGTPLAERGRPGHDAWRWSMHP